MSNRPYAFISYSSKETDIAVQVRQVLAENGIDCWIAPQSIRGGSDYTKSIPDAIENCGVFVLICSDNAQNSYWVKSEVIDAISKGKTIIPFIIQNFQLNKEFNFMLSPAHRILAYQNKADAYQRLVDSVRAALGMIDDQPPYIPVAEIPSETEPVQTDTPLPIQTEAQVIEPEIMEFVAPDKRSQTQPDPVFQEKDRSQEPKLVAKRVRAEIKPLPTLVLWIISALYGALTIFLITRDLYYSAPFLMLCQLLIVFGISLTCFILVKKTPTATSLMINRARVKLLWLHIGYIAVSLIAFIVNNELDITGTISGNLRVYDITSIYTFILTIVFAFLIIGYTVSFKKDKYFLCFKSRSGKQSAFSSVPVLAVWIVYLINLYFCLCGLVAIYVKLNTNLLNTILLTTTFALIVTLVCMPIVKKHSTAPIKTINKVRYVLAGINILGTLVAYIYTVITTFSVASDGIFNWYSSAWSNTNHTLIPLITTGLLSIASIVITIVFRKSKYTYEYA